jgi:hypothetical protein
MARVPGFRTLFLQEMIRGESLPSFVVSFSIRRGDDHALKLSIMRSQYTRGSAEGLRNICSARCETGQPEIQLTAQLRELYNYRELPYMIGS